MPILLIVLGLLGTAWYLDDKNTKAKKSARDKEQEKLDCELAESKNKELIKETPPKTDDKETTQPESEKRDNAAGAADKL